MSTSECEVVYTWPVCVTSSWFHLPDEKERVLLHPAVLVRLRILREARLAAKPLSAADIVSILNRAHEGISREIVATKPSNLTYFTSYDYPRPPGPYIRET